MIDGVLTGAKLLLRIMVIGAISTTVLIALVTIFNAAIALIIGINTGILGDIMALVQIWLPFNLAAVVTWVVTSSLGYLVYRFALISRNFIQGILGTN